MNSPAPAELQPSLSTRTCLESQVLSWSSVIIIVLAAILHGVMILHATPLQSANDRSRWCTVRALCESGRYEIDDVRQQPGWDTIDLIRREGHFYSTKPPLQATWVASVVGSIQRVTGWTFSRHLQEIHATTLLMINGLPFIVGLMALGMWLRTQIVDHLTEVFVMIVAAFGTLVSPFLTSLNNHTPAAWGVLIATLCWQSPRMKSPWLEGLRFTIWGFTASWAAAHDLPAAAFAAAMGLFALRQDWRWTWLAFAPAALIPIAAFLGCNIAALGTWRPAYAGYGSDSYLFIERGVPSYWLQPQGVDRNLDSPAVYLWNCVLGHHGWFSLTPVWLLVAWRSWSAAGSVQVDRRWLIRSTWVLSGIVLGFYLTRTENYNYGGVSCGLRWAMFLIPLWVICLPDILISRPWTCGRMAFAALMLGISLYSAWSPMSKAWQQPWLYQLEERWGWIPGKDSPPPFDHALYSWFDDLPSPRSTNPVWVEFARTGFGAHTERLRLAYQGDVSIAGRPHADLRVTMTHNANVTDERRWLIDRENFTLGKPSAECLHWIGTDITPAEQQSDLTLYRGLPRLKAYHPGYERYLHVPLRDDAFACQRAAAQCDVTDSNSQRVYRHRSDIWLSREIPFGTARMEWAITDPASGEILHRQVWEVAQCEPPVAPSSPITREMFNKPEPIFRQVAPR